MFDFSQYGNHPACITSDGVAFSYIDLDSFVHEIKSNVQPHQLVFCLCSNNLASLGGYLAFVNNSNATLLLDSHIGKESFDTLYSTYLPKYIWAPDSFSEYYDVKKVYSKYGYTLCCRL